MHFSPWSQCPRVDSLADAGLIPPKSFHFTRTRLQRGDGLTEKWRRPCSTRRSSSVWTQKGAPSHARFASGPRRACFASLMPVRSMRPPNCPKVGRKRFYRHARSSCQEQVSSAAFCHISEACDAFKKRKNANSLTHLIRAVRGRCEPGSSWSLGTCGPMNDFSESGAAVRFVTAWCVHVEGKRNFDARGVEIVRGAAVGAEMHACMA